jgi:hypothetical protein
VYSGVVGIESVRLILALAEMDDYQVCAADIGNAFFYGQNKEKTMIIAGPEFGESLQGKLLVVQGGMGINLRRPRSMNTFRPNYG